MSRERECPSCASMVPADEDRCLVCGYEFPNYARRRNWRTWAAVILLIVFLYPLFRLVLKLIR